MDKILSLHVNQAAATTATLLAAVAGKQIQVTGFCLTVENGALGVESTLQDETANTVRMTLTSQAATAVVVYSYSAPDSQQGVFATAPGEGLELVTGAAAIVAGIINYRYV
jgi:hypothetical protein